MHTLFTWLGNRDVENMERDEPASIATIIEKSRQPVDKVVILANQHKDVWNRFVHIPGRSEQLFRKHLNTYSGFI